MSESLHAQRAYSVLHLTDLHLLADAQARLKGWQVEHAFIQTLAAAQALYPQADALVLGGDLVDDESIAGYQRLDSHLARLDMSVLAMAGNHDSPTLMQTHLRHACVHGRLRLGRWQLVALDTHIDASDAGRISASSLGDLASWLSEPDQHTLIGLHHPPCALGSIWMDAIGLHNLDTLAAVAARHPAIAGLICGHAHQAATHAISGKQVWITPSTMRQFLPTSDVFAEDPSAAPGFRHLWLHRDGHVETTVHRLPEVASRCGPVSDR